MPFLPHEVRTPTAASHDDHASPVVLMGRQATTTLVTSAAAPADCAGQYSGGTLAGAILGTFFGTLLLLYLFSVINPNFNRGGGSSEEVIVEKRRRHKSRSGSHSSVKRPGAVYSTR